MTDERRGVLSYLLALGLFVAAASAGLYFLQLAGTVGDAQFLPPGVCDVVCQEQFRQMGQRANLWGFAAALMIVSSIVFLVRGYRFRRTQ